MQQQAINLHSPQVRAIGPLDVTIGLGQLLDNINGSALVSNLKCTGVDSIIDHQILNIQSTKIGFMSLWSPSQSVENCKINAPANEAKEIMSRTQAEIWVLISHLSANEENTLLEQSEFDIVIDAMDLQARPPQRHKTGSVLIGAGGQGKRIGQFSIQLEKPHRHFEIEGARAQLLATVERYNARLDAISDAANERTDRQRAIFTNRRDEATAQLQQFDSLGKGSFFEHSITELSRSVLASPRVEALIENAKQDFVALASSQPLARYVGDYVGSESCQPCHTEIFNQWLSTDHSRAWATLIREQRALDNDCYSCHVTGAFSDAGPKSPMSLRAEGQPHSYATLASDIMWGPLVNVGCEACHGQGGDHILQPAKENIQRSVPVRVCTECHDGEKDDRRFDLETYWPRLVHGSAWD